MERMAYIATNDAECLSMLESILPQEGFKTKSFARFSELPSACEAGTPNVVVMDISGAKEEGLGVCSVLRNTYPGIWITILSDQVTPYDRVTGLMIGCDEYLSKPFLLVELQARIHAYLRREGGLPKKTSKESAELTFGPLTLYPEQRYALHNGVNFPLTPTEFDFLALLIERNGIAVSREEFLGKLWKVTWNANTRAIDDLVKRLRNKMRLLNSPVVIETVWGYGFRLTMNAIG